MRVFLLSFLLAALSSAQLPTFHYSGPNASLVLLGSDPSRSGETTIRTVVVPVVLRFESRHVSAQAAQLDPATDLPALFDSPIFSGYSFAARGRTQYLDALLHATFPKASPGWRTLLAKPNVHQGITVDVPPAYGYLLTSKKAGRSVGIADLQFVQRAVFKQIPRQESALILAVTHNTAFYAEGDATICCSFGTHGVDSASGNSFVLASYLREAPSIVEENDVQPLTEQLAEFAYDPLHDPLIPEQSNASKPGNVFPRWRRPASMRPGDQGRCAGSGVATPYFLLEPTDTNRKNNFPSGKPFVAAAYHLQNAALLAWYLGDAAPGLGHVHSFPDSQALPAVAQACAPRGRDTAAAPEPSITAIPRDSSKQNAHELIGYWNGYRAGNSLFTLPDVSPQWDVVIVAFATPAKNAPEGAMEFHTPLGLSDKEFKDGIQVLKSRGVKVLVSLGGGGQFFSLDDPARVAGFVSSVGRIVADYGFDGVDIDFETPSLVIASGDTDFRHPKTPSIVHLIAGLRQLHDRFGRGFLISLVPEGPQFPAGYAAYGGQFGSYLPLAWGLRDILTFMDVQDYNTPPLQGLDGEIYQAGSVDYHAAVTELVLHGFPVGGDAKSAFPPVPANKTAIGFLIGETTPETVRKAVDYVTTGKIPAGVSYRLRQSGGYDQMLGAMFWTIDADRRSGYPFSNVIGPQLHNYPAAHKAN